MQKIPLSEYRPMLDEALKKLVSGEHEYDVEFKVQRPNDGRIVDIHSVAEYDPAENTLTGIIKDITAQKQYEEKIKLFKTIFDNANYGSAIVDLDGNINYINDYFAKIHGFEPDELIGQNLSIFHDEEQMADVSRLHESLLQDGYYTNLEVWHTHRDGTAFPMLMSGIVIKDKLQNPLFMSATAIDITEMKDKEYKLRESEHKFRSYINNAPDGIFVADNSGYYIDVNNAACEMTGYSEDELIGMNLLDLLPSDIHEYAINKFEDSKSKGKIDIEIPYLTKEGDKRWWRVTAASLSENKVIGFVKDITKQKNTESALSEALTHSQQREKEINELLNSTTAILEIDDFEVVARHIFDACARVIGAKAGYVALLSDEGEENELLFLEDGGMPCSVDPDLPMPVRGLRAEAYETGEVVYENDFMASEWIKYMPEGHMDLPNVLFSPLNIEGKTVGLLGFAYKNGDFTEHDAWLAKNFGEHAAIALKNSRNFELLEKSEQRYRSIFETAANLITSVNSDGIIVDCNNQMRHFLGYEKDEIIGLHMSKIIHPDYLQKAFDSLQKVLESGSSYNKEYKLIKKSGDLVDVLVNSSGINKRAEGYERTICIINDITQRNKNLQRINYLTDTLRCIRDVNQTIIKESNSYESLQKICDSLTKYNNYTAAWIGIFDENNKINMITESGHSNKFDDFLEYTKTNVPHCAQCALEANDYIIIENPEKECSGCPLQNEYGREDVFVSNIEYGNKVYGTIALTIPEGHVNDEKIIDLSKEVVGDISFSLYNLELEALRQNAEESLLEGKLVAEEANRTKSEFLANMSHELRTPLNSVIGFSQVLKKNASNHLDDKEIKYVSNVIKSGTHLLELINNILDLSKVESGEMDYVPENINLSETVNSTVVLVEPMANKKEIYLNYEDESGNIKIQADRMKFKEILYNLLSNAIKFTPEKGEVFVKSKIIDDHIQVSVSDTGVGIPEEKYQSIFDPFKQADSSPTRKYGGTGLGLALVKKYVEIHGGEIWLESEVGKGSTFTFTMPLD
jgi:PAS domain S-box-containing protein